MKMKNPPHPGEIIRSAFLDTLDISIRELANHLDIAPSTMARLVRGDTNMSPEMAIRLSICLGRSPESWMRLQENYDLSKALKAEKLFKKVKKLPQLHSKKVA